MSNLRKIGKQTVQIREEKSTPNREKLTGMDGGGLEDASGKMLKLG